MLQTLLDRWRGTGPKTAPRPPQAVTPGSRDKPTPSAASTVHELAAATATVGARRALVDQHGRIVGYEFSVGPALLQRLQQRPDSVAVKAHFQALLAGMRLGAAQGRLAYAEVPAAWLGLVEPGQVKGLHMGLVPATVHPEPSTATHTLKGWRAAGAQLGWSEGTPGMAACGHPDFCLRQRGAGATTSAPEAPTRGRPWVAPDEPDVDALDAALASGALWAGCSTRFASEPRQAKALPMPTQALMRLLNRLIRDDDTAQIVDEIKRDAALCARLLQHLNSAGVTGQRGLESIEQAVSVLGRNALYQWVAALLVRQSGARPAASSMQALALARARLLESLARAAGEASPGSLYVVGLASVLPQLMQASLADVLAGLSLPADAERALRHREGPWGHYLDLAEALEAPDLSAVQRLSGPAGGLQATMALSAQAWLAH